MPWCKIMWSLSWSSSLLISAVIIRAFSSLSLSLSLSTARAPAGYHFLFSSFQPPYEERANNSLLRSLILHNDLLRVTRGTRNPNLQGVITHVSHVCSQHSFGLPLRINGILKMQYDHAHFDLLPLIICSRVFWPSVKWNLHKAQGWSRSVCTCNRCRRHSITFGNY